MEVRMITNFLKCAKEPLTKLRIINQDIFGNNITFKYVFIVFLCKYEH